VDANAKLTRFLKLADTTLSHSTPSNTVPGTRLGEPGSMWFMRVASSGSRQRTPPRVQRRQVAVPEKTLIALLERLRRAASCGRCRWRASRPTASPAKT
jgi:hypothetical protein